MCTWLTKIKSLLITSWRLMGIWALPLHSSFPTQAVIRSKLPQSPLFSGSVFILSPAPTQLTHSSIHQHSSDGPKVTSERHNSCLQTSIFPVISVYNSKTISSINLYICFLRANQSCCHLLWEHLRYYYFSIWNLFLSWKETCQRMSCAVHEQIILSEIKYSWSEFLLIIRSFFLSSLNCWYV